jgi:two-component system alkaline phosphatase synthesis response regulator PhoP
MANPAPGATVAERRVLIVDDEDAICNALTVLFRRAGYTVLTARSAQVAKDLLGTAVVDCLVIDYRIPDLRGDVLFAYAVAVQPHLEGHAVFLTGDVTDRTRDAIADTGCPLLLKPFENSQLLGLVSRFFEDARSQRPS